MLWRAASPPVRPRSRSNSQVGPSSEDLLECSLLGSVRQLESWMEQKESWNHLWVTHLTSPVRSQQVEDNILNWLPPPLLPRHSLKSEIWELFWELGYFCNIRIKNNILTIFQHQFKITTDLYIDTITQRHSIFNIKTLWKFSKIALRKYNVDWGSDQLDISGPVTVTLLY